MARDEPPGPIRLENPFLSVEVGTGEGDSLFALRFGDSDSSSDRDALAVDAFLGDPEDRLSGYPRLTETSPGGVSAATVWESVTVEQHLSLLPIASALRFSFAFRNRHPIHVRPAFGLMFRLPPHESLRWRVPTADGPRSDPFSACPEQRYLRPSEPWCGWEVQGQHTLLLFPKGVIDAVEIRRAPSGAVSLTPLIYFLGLSPGCEAEFQCLLLRGDGDFPSAAELWDTYAPELRADYRRSSPESIRQAEAIRAELAGHVESSEVSSELARYRARMERLSEGTARRMTWIHRLGSGEVSVEDVLRHLE